MRSVRLVLYILMYTSFVGLVLYPDEVVSFFTRVGDCSQKNCGLIDDVRWMPVAPLLLACALVGTAILGRKRRKMNEQPM